MKHVPFSGADRLHMLPLHDSSLSYRQSLSGPEVGPRSGLCSCCCAWPTCSVRLGTCRPRPFKVCADEGCGGHLQCQVPVMAVQMPIVEQIRRQVFGLSYM
eukprot:UN2833